MDAAHISAWLAAHKGVALGGAAAGVGAFALYRKSKAASTAGSTTATSADGTTASVPSAGYDSSDSDIYNSLEGQIGTLSDQLSGITSSSTNPLQGVQSPGPTGVTPVSTPTTSTPIPITSQAPAPKTPTAPSPSYLALTSAQAVTADIASGMPLYQSGAEGLAWDLKYGNPAGQPLPTVGDYYQLSPAAAKGLAAAGNPVYVKT